MTMEEIEVKDKVKIINYAHPIWVKKDVWNELYLAGYVPKKPVHIISEDETHYTYDQAHDLVGRIDIVKEISHNRYSLIYSGAWFTNKNLELVSKYIPGVYIDYRPEPDDICLHCNKPLYLMEMDNVYIHQWHRWKNDNGYFCTEHGTQTAKPKNYLEKRENEKTKN